MLVGQLPAAVHIPGGSQRTDAGIERAVGDSYRFVQRGEQLTGRCGEDQWLADWLAVEGREDARAAPGAELVFGVFQNRERLFENGQTGLAIMMVGRQPGAGSHQED